MEREFFKRQLEGSMKVFKHHLYEYEKGLRNLILHTTDVDFKEDMINALERKGVAYLISPVEGKKINVFFGDEKCIQVVNSINKKLLSDYTDEEDFILGIMLGYDRLKQCERYIKRKSDFRMVEELIG